MENNYDFIATTMFGLEDVLQKELIDLNASNIKTGNRCVYFQGDQNLMYRANIKLRTALKILKKIKIFKAKKESETLRTIMKGYIATIDSVNQLNIALTEENFAMKERVEEVQDRNEKLERRQENMEEIIAAGQILQCADISAIGVRLLSSGRQRETSRADRADMLKVCFTLLENAIADPGDKNLYLNVLAPDSTLLPFEPGADYSAKRTIDYSNDRLDACVFYTTDETSKLASGMYHIEILEESEVIGSTDIELR